MKHLHSLLYDISIELITFAPVKFNCLHMCHVIVLLTVNQSMQLDAHPMEPAFFLTNVDYLFTLIASLIYEISYKID